MPELPQNIYDKALPTKLVLGFSLTHIQNTFRMILDSFREDINLHHYSNITIRKLPAFTPPLIFRLECNTARTLEFVKRRETVARENSSYSIAGGRMSPVTRFTYLHFPMWKRTFMNGYEDANVLILPLVYWNIDAKQISETSNEAVLIHQVGILDIALSMDKTPTIRSAGNMLNRAIGTLQFRDMFVLCYSRFYDSNSYYRLTRLTPSDLFLKNDEIDSSAQNIVDVRTILPQRIYRVIPKNKHQLRYINWDTILCAILCKTAAQATESHRIIHINKYPANTPAGIIANEQTPIVWTRDPVMGYRLLSDYYKAMCVKAVQEQLAASPTENKQIKREQEALAKNFLDLLQEVS